MTRGIQNYMQCKAWDKAMNQMKSVIKKPPPKKRIRNHSDREKKLRDLTNYIVRIQERLSVGYNYHKQGTLLRN